MEEAALLSALPLAVSLARKWARETGYRLEREEAEAEARVALVIAGQTFDASRGIAFESWVYVCVRRQLVQAVRSRLGRNPDNPKRNDYNWQSLSSGTGRGAPASASDGPEDRTRQAERAERRLTLWQLIQTLPPRERLVVEGTLAGVLDREQGEMQGVGPSMIATVRRRAVARMRRKVTE